MTSELSSERIKLLYDEYRKHDPWPQWREVFLADVTRFQGMSDAEFDASGAQAALWRARGIATLGPGEAVGIGKAHEDGEIVGALSALRKERWPEEPSRRSRELQDAYDRVLALVFPKHSKARPQAKLARLFMALVPQHLHAGFSWEANRNVAKLLLGTRKTRPIESSALVRARLRVALGEELDLTEHVHRAMFCWWLHEWYETISAGEAPVLSEEPVVVKEEPPNVEERASGEVLTLWPVIRQRKGIAAVHGYVEGYRAVVAAAQGGASPDDLVDTMRSDLGFAGYGPKSCRQIFNRVRRLGFLEHNGGLWYPSEDGERLLGEEPPHILVEKILVQTFGLAHWLRILESGTKTRAERNALLRSAYPAWTSDFMPSAIGAWSASLGLVDANNGVFELTEYGRDWAKRLPAELETPTAESVENEEDEIGHAPGVTAPVATTAWPTLGAILEEFEADDELSRFVFTREQIRTLHLAWHCQPRKRFALLSGLSGTGKTALVFHYARIYAKLMGLSVDEHRAVVAVSPDWRDPTGLLGYFNALHADPTFQAEPALRLVLDAVRHPDLPYFLILDEMNLARAEQYFAPFLSSMETGQPIELHAEDEPVNGVPPRVAWPTNLFVAGTVNMDETTHPFSDKVLDRAFVLEFWDVDLDDFLSRRATGPRELHIEGLLVETYNILRGGEAPLRLSHGRRGARFPAACEGARRNVG